MPETFLDEGVAILRRTPATLDRLLALACGGLMLAARTQSLWWLTSMPAPRTTGRLMAAPPSALATGTTMIRPALALAAAGLAAWWLCPVPPRQLLTVPWLGVTALWYCHCLG